MLCNQEMAQVLEAFQRVGLFAKFSGPQQTQLGGKLLGGTHLESNLDSKLGPLHCLDKRDKRYDQQLHIVHKLSGHISGD